MRLIVSFFLSLLIYLIIVFLFLNFLFRENTKKDILIHTAIVVENKNNSLKNITTKKNKHTKNLKKEIKKSINKKSGSKTNIEKGGDVSFDEIFKNVNTNVPTSPVKLKKSEMSRFKGLKRIEKNLKKVKLLNINISYENKSSNVKKGEIDKIIEKISKVWYDISNIPGEYAKINVVSNNGNIEVIILDSNIDENKQIELINLIKKLKFDKNFNLNILFQTKVSK